MYIRISALPPPSPLPNSYHYGLSYIGSLAELLSHLLYPSDTLTEYIWILEEFGEKGRLIVGQYIINLWWFDWKMKNLQACLNIVNPIFSATNEILNLTD